MKSRNHVVITGTGRAGTSFLVQLLTYLELSTGFKISDLENNLDDDSKAGLEFDIRNGNVPYVVKSPHFCNYAQEVFSRKDITIDHIIIPYRDIKDAAMSRIRVSKESKKADVYNADEIPGGLWDTIDPKKQEIILYEKLNKLTSVRL